MSELIVDHLRKVYRTRKSSVEAIRELSFAVERGEFVSVVGPSGAGKTTLLRCLSGLLRPSGGRLQVAGQPIVDPPESMSMVFQNYSVSLLPWMSVADNVALPIRRKVARSECVGRVTEALGEVGLDGFADSYPWQLSGGMQQRVAIARALAFRPRVMLMDEPFASVDAQTRSDLEDLVLRVHRDYEMTILFVTHDMDEAVYLSDRVLVVSQRPTTLVEEVLIDLPRPRDQLSTKIDPRFIELRAHVFQLIRGAHGHVVPQIEGVRH